MKKSVLFPFLSCFFVFGCGPAPTTRQNQRIDGVTRVLIAESHHLILLVRERDGSEIVHDFWICNGYAASRPGAVRFIRDVPADSLMWAVRTWHPGSNCEAMNGRTHSDELVIHLRDEAQVHGAGWNHGKHGKGTTSVVE